MDDQVMADQPRYTVPSAERQAELVEAYDSNTAHGNAPYEGVRIQNLGELEWALALSRQRGYESANLTGVILDNVDLRGVTLREVNLTRAQLRDAKMAVAQLSYATLRHANLERANLEGANLARADLTGARLVGATLDGALLIEADLSNTEAWGAHLVGATIVAARLGGANLTHADLRHADLRQSFFDAFARLHETYIDGNTFLSDVVWNGALLTRVAWDSVRTLGEEHQAHEPPNNAGDRKQHRIERLRDYEAAGRAYRQLSAALRGQGMNDAADGYAYRAQRMQRVVLRLRRRYLSYLGSLFIDLLAGYGFRPERSLLVYLAVILWFANFYVWASHGLFSLGLPPTHVQPLAWYEGLILSVSSFHGRGFQPFQNLNDPIAALAGMQAVFGLIIEVSFIATFTQRFFAR